jgi:hypothetical protein
MSERQWKPCRCCGGREVTKTAIVEGHREWVIVECRFCEARRGAYYRRKKETLTVKTIKIPPRFYNDHYERDLPTPDDVGNAKSYVLVRADDPALPELLNDAEYYAHPYGPDADWIGGIRASAKATVRAIRNVTGWDDAEPAIQRLRKPAVS